MRVDLTPAAEGRRIDVLVAEALGLGRAEARRLCDDGRVLLDGRRVAKGATGQPGSRLEIDLAPTPSPPTPLVEAWVDPWLVIVDKQAGQPTHPLRLHETGTLAQALAERYPEMVGLGADPREAGLVHRLDTGTSGLLLAARTPGVFQALRQALAAGASEGEGGITKHYVALCGRPPAVGRLAGWLWARGPRVSLLAQARPGARAVALHVLEVVPWGRWYAVRVSVAHAGRHQVRAQLAAAGAPLVGDVAYGGEAVAGVEHHRLHATRIAFRHPVTGAEVVVDSPPPWPPGGAG